MEKTKSKTKKIVVENPDKFSWEVDGARILNDSKARPLSDYEKKVLKCLVTSKSCPKEYRKELWRITIGMESKIKENLDYYEKLKGEAIPPAEEEKFSKIMRTIDVDIPRTFYTQEEIKVFPDKTHLSNILKAFAKRHPEIGYYSGMSFIAGTFLRYLNEEEAFWGTCYLYEEIYPIGFYSLEKSIYDISGSIVKTGVPALYAHFENLKIYQLQQLLFTWIKSAYAYNIQISICEAIWDQLLLCGFKTLFRAGLAIFSLFESKLLEMNDINSLLRYTIDEKNYILDIQSLLKAMKSEKFKFIKRDYLANEMKSIEKSG